MYGQVKYTNYYAAELFSTVEALDFSALHYEMKRTVEVYILMDYKSFELDQNLSCTLYPCPLIHLITELCNDLSSLCLQWIVDTIPHQLSYMQCTVHSVSAYPKDLLEYLEIDRTCMISRLT